MKILDIIAELDKSKNNTDISDSSVNIGHLYLVDFSLGTFPFSYSESRSILFGKHYESEDKAEFSGYCDALLFAYSLKDINALNESIIRSIHRKIYHYIVQKRSKLGEYKLIQNNIIVNLNTGSLCDSRFLLLKTCEPWRVAGLLKASINDLKNPKGNFHQLINLGIFIGRFLYINPFQDGNIFVARVLVLFLLRIAGYDFAKYFVIWNFLDKNNEECKNAISSIPESHIQDIDRWENWLLYFLKTILFFINDILSKSSNSSSMNNSDQKNITKHTDEYKKNFVQDVSQKMTSLSSTILSLFDSVESLTIAEICLLTSANRNTIKLHLKNLVNSGCILMHGSGRGVRYTIKK